MGHTGDGSQWKENEPNTQSESVSDGAKEIRDLRIGVNSRISKEHVQLGTGNSGGEHKSGSAKGYYQLEAPTTRPDGTTLSDIDNGRVWVASDTRELFVYVHPTWMYVQTLADGMGTNSIGTSQLVNNAVTTEKIADLQITGVKVANTLDLSTKTVTLPSGITVLLPTIASFVNANHAHTDAASGGVLTIPKINWGTYSGNGASTRDITSGSNGNFTWTPKLVIVGYAGATYLKIASVAGSTGILLDDGSHPADVITLATNKFTVHSSRTNYSGRSYSWFALGV